jgi:hypothetical protein
MSLMVMFWACSPEPPASTHPTAPVVTDPPPTSPGPPPTPIPVTLRFEDEIEWPTPVPDVVCEVDGVEGRSDAEGSVTLWVTPRPGLVEIACAEQVQGWFMPVRVVVGLEPGDPPFTLEVLTHRMHTLQMMSVLWAYPPYDPLRGSVTVHVTDNAGRPVPGTRAWVEGDHDGALREDPALKNVHWSLGPVTVERGHRVWFDNVEVAELGVRARSPGRRCHVGDRHRVVVDVRANTNTIVRMVCEDR